MPNSLKVSKVEVFSTVVEDVDIDFLQKSLESQRNLWINAYLAKDFSKIEPLLSPDFRCVNGKEISNKAEWHEILKKFWQSKYRQDNPLLPDRIRYHFFTANECMMTLYFKDEKYANVMQELWMKNGNTWQFNALSTVNR